MLPQRRLELTLKLDEHAGRSSTKGNECGEWRCSFLVEDLTLIEAPGDVVGLSLSPHCGRVGCQVTCRRHQHVRAGSGVTQTGILPKGGFDGLYRMEVAILPEEQAPPSPPRVGRPLLRHRCSWLPAPRPRLPAAVGLAATEAPPASLLALPPNRVAWAHALAGR